MTLAEKILAFNSSLHLSNSQLPNGISAMNPFKGEHAKLINSVTKQFYQKYYNDNRKRRLIIGINPGRLGAGLTGIPFTDTKRLGSDCGIEVTEVSSHEPSSVFVYEVVNAFGGPKAFYDQFYINSVCPLGFTKTNEKGREVNYNYYDRKDLEEAVTPFIIKTLKQQLAMGLNTDEVYCLGGGKNFKFLQKLNKQEQLFGNIVPLDHPRYIVQYKNKLMPDYVQKYLQALSG